MATTIEAVYENGALRLKKPMGLNEGTPVEITIVQRQAIGEAQVKSGREKGVYQGSAVLFDQSAIGDAQGPAWQPRVLLAAALTSRILHDVRNPLGAMETQIRSMMHKFLNIPEVIVGLEAIDNQRRRVSSLLKTFEILVADYDSNLERMERVSVEYLVARAVHRARESNLANILFRVESKHVFIEAYPTLIDLAISNILTNAVDAIVNTTYSKNGVITIRTTLHPKSGSLVRIEIMDNGCGIPKQYLSKVETPFFTTKESRPGMGLSIAARITEIHGGKLMIESKAGKGATVTLLLPKIAD